MADINKWVVASIELGCTVIFFLSRSCEDFSLKQWRFPVTDGRCEHHTTFVYTCTFRFRELFSRGLRKHGVSSKVIFTSSTPCLVHSRCCFRVWSDLPHLTPSESLPLLSFERRWSHYSATWATLWPSGWDEHSYRLWAQRSHWSERYGGFTDVLPQTEQNVDLCFSWEHCYSLQLCEREKQVPSQESHLRHSRHFLGALSSSRRRWSIIQTFWIGK